jgi:hypothetical protein
MATTKDERALHVAQMRANFAQEGGVPDPEHETLLNCYIEGTSTLADLYEHAHEYALAAQEREYHQREQQELSVPLQPDFEQFEASMKIYDEEHMQKDLANIAMSDEQRKRQESADFARAPVGLSGFTVSEETERDSARYISGEINMKEYLALRRR